MLQDVNVNDCAVTTVCSIYAEKHIQRSGICVRGEPSLVLVTPLYPWFSVQAAQIALKLIQKSSHRLTTLIVQQRQHCKLFNNMKQYFMKYLDTTAICWSQSSTQTSKHLFVYKTGRSQFSLRLCNNSETSAERIIFLCMERKLHETSACQLLEFTLIKYLRILMKWPPRRNYSSSEWFILL